jgi:hypothetical protein
MALFLFYTIILLLTARSYGLLKNKYFIYNIIFALTLCIFTTLESLYYRDSIFILPDEFGYLKMSNNIDFIDIIKAIHERYMAYILHVKIATLISPDYILKIINIPLIIILMIYLTKKYNNILILKYGPLFIPYLYIMSVNNMREVMANLVFFILLFNIVDIKIKNIHYVIILSVLLWSLRMQWFVVLFFSVLLLQFKQSPFIIKKVMYTLITIVLIALMMPFFNDKYSQYLGLSSFNNFNPTDVIHDNLELSGMSEIELFITAILKQLLTPLPTSKIEFLLFSNSMSNNLYLSEISRIIMNTVFYCMIIYTLFHIKSFYRFIMNNKANYVLFLVSVSTSLIYAFYMFGSGGSRTKLFPIILLFLFYVEKKSKKV